MYTTSQACATVAASGKGPDQSQTGLASNLMWQNTQLPVIWEDNRPHSLFSRHMRTFSFATFTFCSSPLSLSSHLLPGVNIPRPTGLMKRNGLRVCLLLKQQRLCAGEHSLLLSLLLLLLNQDVSPVFSGSRTEDKNSWIDTAEFRHFPICALRVCWCKHAWRLGTLARGTLWNFF